MVEPLEPPRWTSEQLAEDAAESAERFRRERLGEPLDHWMREYDARAGEFRRLFQIHGIAHPQEMTASDIVRIFEADLGDAFRYLAGPPISADDLKTLADVASLRPSGLAANNGADAQAILEIFRATADPRRFPWIAEQREPTDAEVEAAIASSAALIAGQRVQTERRNSSKAAQEQAVKEYLRSVGFTECSTPRQISTLEDAPSRGSYCNECLVGSRKADVPIRLFDGRLMPLECKVSNSALNSIKRINNDAAVKARIWLGEFGSRQVVPAGMLSGVFDVSNLVRAQEGALTIFWSHDMEAMGRFIAATRPAA